MAGETRQTARSGFWQRVGVRWDRKWPFGLGSPDAVGDLAADIVFNPNPGPASTEIQIAGFNNADQVPGGQFSAGAVAVTLGGTDWKESFGVASIGGSAAVLPVVGIASGELFGAPSVQVGAVTLDLSAGRVGTSAFGSVSIAASGVTIPVVGIDAPAQTDGTGTVIAAGPVALSASGFVDASAFGIVGISASGVAVPVVGLRTGEAFGSAALSAGAVSVSVGDIQTGYKSGVSTITSGATPVPVLAIPSGEAFGGLTITRPAVSVSAGGLASDYKPGITTVLGGGATIALVGIQSKESHGSPGVLAGSLLVPVASIAGVEIVAGFSNISFNVNLNIFGIPANDVFGSARLWESVRVAPGRQGYAAPSSTRHDSFASRSNNQPSHVRRH